MKSTRASGKREAALIRRAHAADMRKPVLTLGLALSALALAAPQRYEMRSYVNTGGKVQPAFAWCDAPDRVIAVTQPRNADLSRPQPVKLRQVLKRPAPNTDAFDYVAEYRLGPSDAGAGQLYTAITFPDGTGDNQRYFIHTSNIENVIDPAYRMTHVNEFRTPEGAFRCRYVPQAAFLGATAKRSVIVWDNGKTATYATRNFDGTPGVYVTSGRRIASAELTAYEFTTRDGYRYRVEIRPPTAGGMGSLSVFRGSLALQTEPFLAYSISEPVQEQP
ncbi:hypothetical protein Dgeo_2414 (plasmid) [Deinococcus geothermalis DSM 11300]|uniref:Uncharacterized protein n=2 Tax=Deinococcus geothermalis TaxID=68909 RepID=Q1J3T6_DEIGD|nr:hypothetical protein Dgeo_2414 [Deinococcus geothermalis DSM 11300]